MSSKRILIVGGGLGGLALGQGLKKAKFPVPFHIFERDSDAAFRAQGYRIRISPEGAAALSSLLPAERWSQFEATCAPPLPSFSQVDALTGKAVPGAGGPPRGAPTGRSYNADRTLLRNVLLGGMEQHISFNKKFVGYQRISDEEFEASFSDGSVERASMIIGADGSKSLVRRSLLPDFHLLDTDGRAVFGKTELTPDLASRIPEELKKGICLVDNQDEGLATLFCDPMIFDRSSGMDLPADYIYWVLLFRHDKLAKLGLDASIKELLSKTSLESTQLADHFTKSWAENIRILFDNQISAATSTLMFLNTSNDILQTSWQQLREGQPARAPFVTLLGDAAHTMPPVGGVGANVAFQDAHDLYSTLMDEETPLNKTITAYELKMLSRISEILARNNGAAVRFGMRPLQEQTPVAE